MCKINCRVWSDRRSGVDFKQQTEVSCYTKRLHVAGKISNLGD